MTTARKLLTADDLLAMPDDGNRYELVRGELVTMPPPGIMHTVVTGHIGGHIWNFVRTNELDFIAGPEAAAYIEQNPDTVRAADYALIIATSEIVTHSADGRVRRFAMADTLTLEPVLLGFACPVADIFAY